MTRPGHPWGSYLRDYHQARPGITEQLLEHCRGDPYGWLTDAVPAGTATLLDLACGSAPTLTRLTDIAVVGLDTSTAELRLAQARGATSLVRGEADRLPFVDGGFDVVVCSMALQVVTPLPEVLAEIRRVLKPGGQLIALIPASSPLSWTDRMRYLAILWKLRRFRLGHVNSRIPQRLVEHGWVLQRQESRRFAYPIERSRDAEKLVDAFYLPGTAARNHAAAGRLAVRWVGTEIGIPLQLVVATPGGRSQPV